MNRGSVIFIGRYTNELEDIRMNWVESWTCQSKFPGRRNLSESDSAGFGGGHARANPREEEVRFKVLPQGLAVDMPGQTPGKQKSC